MKPRILSVVLIPVVVLLLLSVTSTRITQAVEPVTSFSETFDGNPSSPTPWDADNWDVTIHSRDRHTWYELETMDAAYGPNCEPFPATHSISSYEDAVFQCNGRVMTAIQADGYGVIYLTPNHLMDFSTGESVLRFDLNTLRTSSRDWVDLWVSPYADHLQLPLDGIPSLQGYPRHAIHIRMEQGGLNNELTFFRGTLVTNFMTSTLTTSETPYDTVITPSATKLETFELRISKTHVRFGMPKYNLWWIDKDIPALGWNKGLVQFGHHSFSPTKCDTTCSANTWQWDNVSITPASPLTFSDGTTRFANRDQPRIRLESPVQAGAKLRFAAYGTGMDVSLDGGRTWQKARVQPAQFKIGYHFQSYWMDLPAGARELVFRSSNPDSQDWVVREAAVWYDGVCELPELTWRYLPYIGR